MRPNEVPQVVLCVGRLLVVGAITAGEQAGDLRAAFSKLYSTGFQVKTLRSGEWK